MHKGFSLSTASPTLVIFYVVFLGECVYFIVAIMIMDVKWYLIIDFDLHLSNAVLTPILMYVFSIPPSSFLRHQLGILQLNSDIIYLEIAQSQGLSLQDANCKSRFVNLGFDYSKSGGCHDLW